MLRSIHRLDSFLSYLSEKIKANTLKISACDKPDTASDHYSGTTASHSDLSIDDMNLNRFKEYMLNSDRKIHGHSVRHQTQSPFNNNNVSHPLDSNFYGLDDMVAHHPQQ